MLGFCLAFRTIGRFVRAERRIFAEMFGLAGAGAGSKAEVSVIWAEQTHCCEFFRVRW